MTIGNHFAVLLLIARFPSHMPPAICVDNLGKKYTLRHESGRQVGHRRLSEEIIDVLKKPFRSKRAHINVGPTREEFWALRDVSFDVQQGEVLGIIGRNGAGKSTLLKILSRITEPTRGRVVLRGRSASLLEVGTGFHAELTGRENIFLNGAILGMTRAEIRRKFDEIVAFAEVERFIDTPVKRYSSGMYVRLAFAVAAHLETEILVVDEVLAVGDAQFQRKCFEQMRRAGTNGRTILLVSHNMAAVRAICRRCIAISRGALTMDGDAESVIDGYMSELGDTSEERTRIESGMFYIERVSINSCDNSPAKAFHTVQIRIRLTAKTHIGAPAIYIGFFTRDNQRLAGLDYPDFHTAPALKPGQSIELGFIVDRFPFLRGPYCLEVHLKDAASGRVEIIPDLFPFEVAETPVYGGRLLDGWFGTVGLAATPICDVIESAKPQRVDAECLPLADRNLD